MKNTVSIKLNRDFKRLYYKGGCVGSDILVVYYKRNNLKCNRLGITVGKKIGGAVTRNHIKRLIRESYRLMEGEFSQNYDIVIVARTNAKDASYRSVSAVMRRLFKKSGILMQNKAL
jgi:ribonuclease P protein component